MRESNVKLHFQTGIERLGGITRKWESRGRIGVPDSIVFFKSSCPFFVEFKTIDGGLSGPQRREIKRLRRYGAVVYVCVSFYGVNKLLRRIKKRHVKTI